MSDLSQRLKDVMEKKGITQEKLAEMAGVSQPAIAKIVAGITQKSRSLIDIANALEVDPYWLQNGGDMSVSHTKMEHSQINNNQGQTVNNNFFANEDRHSNNTVKPSHYKQSDDWLMALDLAKGLGKNTLNQRFTHLLKAIQLSDDGLIEFLKLRSAKNIEIITMFNDSMSPLVDKKDVLLIDRTYTQYSGEGIYLFTLNNELYVRRLQQSPDGVITAMAENERAGSTFVIEEHHQEKLNVLGRCIRKIKLQAEDL